MSFITNAPWQRLHRARIAMSHRIIANELHHDCALAAPSSCAHRQCITELLRISSITIVPGQRMHRARITNASPNCCECASSRSRLVNACIADASQRHHRIVAKELHHDCALASPASRTHRKCMTELLRMSFITIAPWQCLHRARIANASPNCCE